MREVADMEASTHTNGLTETRTRGRPGSKTRGRDNGVAAVTYSTAAGVGRSTSGGGRDAARNERGEHNPDRHIACATASTPRACALGIPAKVMSRHGGAHTGGRGFEMPDGPPTVPDYPCLVRLAPLVNS